MAVALDYLLSEMDSDAIILIETLEDFAIFRNHGSENETIDVFQVKSGIRPRTRTLQILKISLAPPPKACVLRFEFSAQLHIVWVRYGNAF